MRSENAEELLLVKYLLGDLGGEEQVRIEDRAFADRAYLNTLEAVEEDLIDTYVRGELHSEQRRAFERRFLIAPQRREKVAFAKALARVSDELKRAELPAPYERSGWRSILAVFRTWHLGLRFATTAAALLCVATVCWLLDQNAALRARLIAAGHQQKELEQQVLHAKQSPPQVRDPQPTAAPATALIATLALSSGLSRAEGSAQPLVLSTGVRLAHIDVQLEPRDEYPRFRIELRTRAGAGILMQSNLTRHPSGAGYAVSIDVPAAALPSGDYELALKGIAASSPAEDVGYYYFSVQRPR